MKLAKLIWKPTTLKGEEGDGFAPALLEGKPNKQSWPTRLHKTNRATQTATNTRDEESTGMANITEILDTVIARRRRCEECCDEADVKWGRCNQSQTRQSRHKYHQSITWFVAFTVCRHYFCSQYFVISVVLTIVPWQFIDPSLLLSTQLVQFNIENQFGVVVVVATSYSSHHRGTGIKGTNNKHLPSNLPPL